MTWQNRIFEETPSAQRRLIISLYILVGFPFSIVMIQSGGLHYPLHTLSVVILILAGFLWMLFRKEKAF